MRSCSVSSLALVAAMIAAATSNAHAGDKIGPDCAFGGFPLKGRVQIVESFPDIKVRLVRSFPDIKVKVVESFPDACGKWMFVESFPDFKVQFVTSFPDIDVEYVESFPGLP